MTLDQLAISENGRFLMERNGAPFFWLADTAWLLFDRLTKEEAKHYLEVRRQQGFNVIQATAVHGLPKKNVYGHQPFVNNDVSKPVLVADPSNKGYWEHIDEIVSVAEEKGLYIAIVPIWGVIKHGRVSVSQAQAYGKWLGQRFEKRSNIVWLNGGDVRGDIHSEVWNALGESIKAMDQNCLMTFHPFGRTRSSMWFHNCDWLDFNMYQSGHRRYGQPGITGEDTEHYGPDNWRYVEEDLKLMPAKPTIDGEPSYELIPQGLHDPTEPLWQAADVRRYAYWSVFAGAAGHTYGHGSVMSMHNEGIGGYGVKKPWHEAIFDDGGKQMQHLKNLILSYSFFDRIPDQSVLASEQGERYERVVITRGKDYLLAYTYTGCQFTLHMGVIAGDQVQGFWYDPRTGKRGEIGLLTNNSTATFEPPGGHRDGNDWVLILENYK